MTRLEERLDALVRAMERQILLDNQVHAEVMRLIGKLDGQADREHDALALLSSDLRTFVKAAALVGTLLIILANVVGPIVVKRLVP